MFNHNDTSRPAEGEVKHLAHSHDPETSRTAAAAATPGKDIVQQAIIELLLEEPRADFELTPAYFALREANGWPLVHPHSIARRRSELHMQGRVVDTGVRRQTEYGRPAVVWAVKDAVCDACRASGHPDGFCVCDETGCSHAWPKAGAR